MSAEGVPAADASERAGGRTSPLALPLVGVVDELREQPDGSVRVTFTRLASVYFVARDGARRAELLALLERSLREDTVVHLTWSLADRSLSLL